MEKEDKIGIFLKELATALELSLWSSLTLSQPREKLSTIKNLYFRPVRLRNEDACQMVVRYKDREETKNFSKQEFLAFASQSIRQHFYYAHLVNNGKEGHLLISKRGFVTLKWKNTISTSIPLPVHDKKKSYTIAPESEFLFRLGIASRNGVILPSQYSKYKQICRYVELLAPLLDETDCEKPMLVADMGCGKGYLTFALHQYLLDTGFKKIKTVGIDLKEKVIQENNRIARDIGLDGLEFIHGSISGVRDIKPNVLIALHACDTATDDAIYYGLEQRSEIIVVAPCCQKQVRKSITVNETNSSLFRYGIIEERFASDLTDLIRANVLRFHGYQVKVMEFVNLEHTPKNLLITAEFKKKHKEEARDEIFLWMRLFGIGQHYLVDKLGWKENAE